MDLTNTFTVKSILTQQGLRPKKSLGQNFLVSKKVEQEFLEACELSKKDAVLEVGAGLGSLTRELARCVKKVIAVELDKNLFAILQKNLKLVNVVNTQTICGNILKDATWQAIAVQINTNFSRATDWKIVGSIPYQITSPLLHKIFFSKNLPRLICWIVQKEVAEKLTAKPPKASYLSNLTALFGKAETIGKTIPSSAFWPQPKVESAILRIRTNHKKPSIDPKKFSRFLHHGFSQPRKMLRAVFDEKDLFKAHLNPQARAGELDLEDWLALFNAQTYSCTLSIKSPC